MSPYRALSILIILGVLGSAPRSHAQKSGRSPDTSESDITLDLASPVNMRPTQTPDASPPITRPIRNTQTPAKDPTDFSVVTSRINDKKAISHAIQLLNPPHKSTYTPGLITFSWKYTTTPKKLPTALLKIERLDGKKKFAFKTHKDKRMIELNPGEYKWQVAFDKPGQASRWRLFKVIGMKSESITKLYEGETPGSPNSRNRKTKKLTTASIQDVIDDEDNEMVEVDDIPQKNKLPTQRRVPTSLPPLPAPSWVKKGLTSLPAK